MWAWWASISWRSCSASPWRSRWPPNSATVIPLWTNSTLVIVISQSGETTDTLAALREAKAAGRAGAGHRQRGGQLPSPRSADDVLYTWAGPEIAVATTKAYSTQLAVLYLLGLYFADLLGTIEPEQYEALVRRAAAAARQSLKQVLEQQGRYSAFRLSLLQPRLHLLHRPQHRLRHWPGGFAEAEGDLLHPLRRHTQPAS